MFNSGTGRVVICFLVYSDCFTQAKTVNQNATFFFQKGEAVTVMNSHIYQVQNKS